VVCVTIQDLGSIGELVGAIATVATLAYLALQIRGGAIAVRATAAQSAHESFATWYRMLAADAGLSELMTNGLRDYSSLSETERARFVSASMAILLCTQDAFIKWREGTLAPDLWSGWEFVTMNLVKAPGGRVLWRERGYMFGAEFRNHVENDLIKRDPHPDAKPLGAFSLGGEPLRGGAV
jgi:hypothetical protein